MNHPYPDAACNTDSSTNGLCNAHRLPNSFIEDPERVIHQWHITMFSLPSNGQGLALLAARGYGDPWRLNENLQPMTVIDRMLDELRSRARCTSCLADQCRCRFTVRWLDAEDEARIWREDHRE